jgi:hypothetical protein
VFADGVPVDRRLAARGFSVKDDSEKTFGLLTGRRVPDSSSLIIFVEL